MHDSKSEPVSAGYKIVEVFRTIFVYLLSVAIIVGAVMFAVSQSPTKSIFGFRYYTVLTDSMKPEFVTGDMVIVKLKNATDIQQGDVITFNPSSDSEAYLTHRVTEKLENYEGTGVTCFKTKGDANNTEDSFLIDESRVIGTVAVAVPKLGMVVRFIQLRWYFMIPLVILVVIFFKLLAIYFSSGGDEEEISSREENQAK
ncbi:MAG: signal peptidase I [Ruminococcus sp.]|nr:signal peptidase I [Ruminococcus sp.]